MESAINRVNGASLHNALYNVSARQSFHVVYCAPWAAVSRGFIDHNSFRHNISGVNQILTMDNIDLKSKFELQVLQLSLLLNVFKTPPKHAFALIPASFIHSHDFQIQYFLCAALKYEK